MVGVVTLYLNGAVAEAISRRAEKRASKSDWANAIPERFQSMLMEDSSIKVEEPARRKMSESTIVSYYLSKATTEILRKALPGASRSAAFVGVAEKYLDLVREKAPKLTREERRKLASVIGDGIADDMRLMFLDQLVERAGNQELAHRIKKMGAVEKIALVDDVEHRYKG
jgi:hypothetical protein